MADAQEYTGLQINEYYLQRQLGRGTFGVVYLAEHIHDQVQVVVKLLRLQLTRTLELKDFLNEARVIRLRHPHIIPILDFGISPQDVPFIVMEYASGGSLRDRFWHGTSLPLPEIVAYTVQVASALQFAHSRRLIHRDVKPENMLLNADGTVLLCDFGIAKIMEQSSTMSVHAQAGTPAYMAPEQAQGDPCPASDQYALAVVVYEWLTGRRPFLGTPLEVAVQHQLNPPPPPCILRPGIPHEAEQVLLKALAKKPAERFETVEQFAQALQFAIDSSPTEKVQALPLSSNPPDDFNASPEPVPTVVLKSPRRAPAPQVPITPPVLPIEQEDTRTSDPLANAVIATRGENAQALSPALEIAESDQTQLIADTASARQAQLRRRILPKRHHIFPALLVLLLIAGCVLGYITFLTPSSTQNQVHVANSQSAYNKAVATTGVMFGFNAQHTGANPYENILSAATVGKLAPTWTIRIGGLLESSPAVANGLIYIGSAEGKLYAFDIATSNAKWTASTNGHIIQSSPAIANGLVYIGSTDGKLYAFDAFSGQPKWAAHTGGLIESSPTLVNGLAYIGSTDGRLYAFNALSGHQQWSTSIGSAILSSPAVANGLVYIGATDGKLYAFDALSGQKKWAASGTPGEYVTFSTPAVANGVVYVSSQDNIDSRDNSLYAFYAYNGVKIWQSERLRFKLSSPAIANSLIYVGSQNGQIYAFNATSGKLQWSTATGSSVKAAPTLANGLFFANSLNGLFSAFDALSGRRMWEYTTGNASESSPAIADGALYTTTQNGQLYAFALSS